MGRPFEKLGNLLLPERKLWDGSYGVALVNTIYGTRPDRPLLRGLGTVLAWSERVGLLAWSDTEKLRADADLSEAAVFAQATDLRALATSFAGAGMARRRPAVQDVATLNRRLADVGTALRVQAGQKAYTLTLDSDLPGLERLFAVITLSLADMVSSGDLWRIRNCDAEGCDLIFLDRSRGPRRRWCDMKTCGNAEKTRLQTRRTQHTRQQRREHDLERHEQWLQRRRAEKNAQKGEGEGDIG